MTKNLKSALAKLDRPPSGQNWVRYNFPEELKTTQAIVSFVLGIPRISYVTGTKIIKDRIELGINLETALSAVRGSGSAFARAHSEKYVRAFFDYDEKRGLSDSRGGFEVGNTFFQVARDVRVPVTPTSVVLRNGKLIPIFVCGWATNPLTLF